MLLTLFVGVFALDAFEPDAPATDQAVHFLLHLLPAIALFAVVMLGWQRPMLGGTTLLALAIGYAIWANEHPGWILTISGPIAIVGFLFIATWSAQRRGTSTE